MVYGILILITLVLLESKLIVPLNSLDPLTLTVRGHQDPLLPAAVVYVSPALIALLLLDFESDVSNGQPGSTNPHCKRASGPSPSGGCGVCSPLPPIALLLSEPKLIYWMASLDPLTLIARGGINRFLVHNMVFKKRKDAR